MANPYFRFKQFTVFHDKSAMKVGTDGVLLGAWADVSQAKQVLDIGAGSGLIALMLAQRAKEASIHAIEIDIAAAQQANENFCNSTFDNLCACKHTSLQDFAQNNFTKFDLIVSNPPFFSQSLKSPQAERTLARHTDSLLIEELIQISAKLLSSEGRLCFIFPAVDKAYLLTLAPLHGLYVSQVVDVLPTIGAEPKRVLMEFSVKKCNLVASSLILEVARHQYTPHFASLVEDFYLNL